jgi:putative hydrolase of the HAD superfamily
LSAKKVGIAKRENHLLSEITAVTFDLWQTLLVDNRELGRARTQVRLDGAEAALSSQGEHYDIVQIREAYRACFRHCRRVREDGLDLSFREQVETFINYISPQLLDRLAEETVLEIERVYADSIFDYPPVLHPAAHSTLQGVREMGLRLGLISNTGMTPGFTFRQLLEQQGVLEYFDVLTFSDEVKLTKPACEIFAMTLQPLNATPAQTIHVGDHVDNDVRGAKRCGLRTVWIEGFYQREDPTDPSSEPDVSVGGLEEVVAAIRAIAE